MYSHGSLDEIMEHLGLRSKETLCKNYLTPGIELGLIRMTSLSLYHMESKNNENRNRKIIFERNESG